MSSHEEIVNGVLKNALLHVENGDADLESAQTLSEALHRAHLHPSEDLRAILVWQDLVWWGNESRLRAHQSVSELLRMWEGLWPDCIGFLEYRGAAIEFALSKAGSRPGSGQQLGEQTQEFIETEILEIAPKMDEEWLETIIPLIQPVLEQDRATLIEANLRAISRSRGSDIDFPENLLDTIVSTDTESTNRAFAVWLSSFEPSLQTVWKTILRMEGSRWADIADDLNAYIQAHPRGSRDSFVRRLATFDSVNVRATLEKIDPSSITQTKLAQTQADFLAKASNPPTRQEALRRIEALGLRAKDARTRLVGCHATFHLFSA